MRLFKFTSAPLHSWLREIFEKHKESLERLHLFDCRFLPEKGLVQMYFILEVKDKIEEISETINNSEDVVHYEPLVIRPNLLIGSVLVSRCTLCYILAKSGCSFRKTVNTKDGLLEWEMIGSSKQISSLLKEIEENEIKVDIKHLGRIGIKKSNLTENQQKLLKIAYELGYFDYPRRISLEELAAKLNLNPSTLSEKMRRAIRNLFKDFVEKRISDKDF